MVGLDVYELNNRDNPTYTGMNHIVITLLNLQNINISITLEYKYNILGLYL